MTNLIDLRREAGLLSEEDRAGLVTHLLASFSAAPLGPDDAEADRRDLELDTGEASAISHEAFVREVRGS